MVALGYESTVAISMDEMLHHAKAVSRGTCHALIVGDMPFGSYQVDSKSAVRNAIRFMKEADCDAVKLEGGVDISHTVSAIIKAGIPVMGHIGLTPQTAGQLGGFKVQGRDMDSARKIIADAKALEAAGVFSIVLECIPGKLAQTITETISVPTIGIGAGVNCDGQVVVTNDLLGLFSKFTPSFIKQYVNLAPLIKEAVNSFHNDVKNKKFPGEEHTFASKENFKTLSPESPKKTTR
jgi:3-methyl-2-oxobutanoate hydroxymethyltransferase